MKSSSVHSNDFIINMLCALIMSLCFVVVSAVEDEACSDWKQVVDRLNSYSRSSSSSSGMELSCTYHPEKCEQADCVGKMNVPIVSAHEGSKRQPRISVLVIAVKKKPALY